jgi:hypothetical protein
MLPSTPGCANRTWQIHHSLEWGADHGPTCIDLLISLCAHYHWLVHEGEWTVTLLAPGRWLWQRPDGTPVPAFSPPPRQIEPLRYNPAIAPDALSEQHVGETFDLCAAVGLLQTMTRAA